MTRTLAFIGLLFTVTTFPLLLSAQTLSQEVTLITTEGQRTLETINLHGNEMIPLDELAAALGLNIGEDTGAGTLTVNVDTLTVILTKDQQLVSVNGRLVSLGAAPRRVEERWFVPLDFIVRALVPVYNKPLEFRPRSRLLLVGDVQVPRISGRYEKHGLSEQLTLDITPNTVNNINETDGRILIEFDADAIDIVRHPQSLGSVARDIQIIKTPPSLLIELNPAYASHSVSTLPASDGSIQLVIDFRAVELASTTETRPAPPTVSPLPSTDALAPFSTAPAIRTIVIDAGHGGLDDGAEGPDGTLEKDITLSVSRLLTTSLERRLGMRVILTRGRDTVVNIDQRAAIANNNNADLFISLHANSSVSSIPAGAEVFYLSIDEYGEEAREIADREGSYVQVVGGGTREIDMVPWEMAQVRHIEQSSELAQIIEDELRRRIPMSPRAIQQAPFRVLVGANMPAVLIEMGFISNSQQEQQLRNTNFQTLIIEAIVSSVVRFQAVLERSKTSTSTLGSSAGGRTIIGQDTRE